MSLDPFSILPMLGFHMAYRWTGEFRIYRHLSRTQWWHRDQLLKLQWSKLRRLLDHSLKTVPLYRKKFREVGIRPDEIKGYEDFRRLPVLTKKEVQQHGDEMISSISSKHKMKPNETGGSTGHPLVFYQDRSFWQHLRADLLRNYVMAGYTPGSRFAFLWGSEYDLKQHMSLPQRIRDRLTMNMLWIDTFNLKRDDIPRHYDNLARFSPRLLVGFTSSLVLFARYALSEGRSDLRPLSIQSSSETLTDADRKLMETAFACPVFNRYGCHEVGNIAHECDSHSGLHVLVENVFLEILDSAGNPAPPGRPGIVVVTNLNNYGMPFIRYRNEDVVVPSERTCPCGRGSPLIERVEGRLSDAIVTPGGRILHGESFTRMFSNAGGIEQFQIVQETPENLLVKIVPGKEFRRDHVLRFLRDNICRHGDPEFKIEFRISDHIEPSPSGKHRYTISKVPVEF